MRGVQLREGGFESPSVLGFQPRHLRLDVRHLPLELQCARDAGIPAPAHPPHNKLGQADGVV
jgi:hypothetical protein